MRADRLLRTVQLLRRHGRLSAADLARRLEVSPRTVLRDMEALSTAGIPVYAERGRDGGFALVPGYEPDVEQLTPDEARSLFVAGGEGVADALGLGGAFGAALRKLAAGLPAEESRRVEHLRERIVLDAGGWHRDAEDTSAMADVTEAVLADDRIRIAYQSKDADRPASRTVDPWGLLQVGTVWYLVAAHRGRPRTYRVSRISRVDRLDEPARRPEGLDLRSVWRDLRDDFRAAPTQWLVLRVHPPRVPMVLRSLGVTMVGAAERVDDPSHADRTTLRIPVRSDRGAAAMLTGFGAEVDVVEPAAVREQIVAIAEEAVAHHRRAARAGRTAYPTR